MLRRSALLALPAGLWALAQSRPPLLPLSEVKPGLRATGRTVFSGSKVEDFDVEILGVLQNAGPKQSVILARLSGGPIEKTGVMQGMSGSPVYYQGRLLGAVALSFPYSKEPIAGIRPIEEMLAADPIPPTQRAAAYPYKPELPTPRALDVGPSKLTEIASPFWLSGFTRGTLDHFAPILRAAGLEPVQGVSSGSGSGPTAPLEPGSMISVQLVSGDLSAGADGTVTHIDGKRLYAFGHRFMGTGDTEIPFAHSEVITLLASINSSFKISNARGWLGTITQDRTTAVAGEIGRPTDVLPVSIRVESRDTTNRNWTYNFKVVRDRLLCPLLLQMSVFSAIDATERSTGLSTIRMKGKLVMDGVPDVPLANVYPAEMGASQMVSAAVAAPVQAILQSDFAIKIKALDLHVTVENRKQLYNLENAWTSAREARPGDTVDIYARFIDPDDKSITRKISYQIPVGAPTGPLFISIVDGASANLLEYKQFLLTPPRSAAQLSAFLHGLHPNDRAYLRLWRNQNSFNVMGDNLNALPASAALSFARTLTPQASSQVGLLAMDLPAAFSGSKTLQIEIKD